MMKQKLNAEASTYFGMSRRAPTVSECRWAGAGGPAAGGRSRLRTIRLAPDVTCRTAEAALETSSVRAWSERDQRARGDGAMTLRRDVEPSRFWRRARRDQRPDDPAGGTCASPGGDRARPGSRRRVRPLLGWSARGADRAVGARVDGVGRSQLAGHVRVRWPGATTCWRWTCGATGGASAAASRSPSRTAPTTPPGCCASSG